MLRKSARLPGREFRAAGYRTATTPFFALKAKDNAGGGIKIGVVANTSFHKSAAKRNFWRRQAKAALLTFKKENKNFLLVLFPRTNTLTKKQFREKLSGAAARLTTTHQ